MTSIPEGAQRRAQQFTLLDNDSASSLFYRPSNALSNTRDDDDSRPNPFTDDPSTPPTGHFDKTSVTPATPSLDPTSQHHPRIVLPPEPRRTPWPVQQEGPAFPEAYDAERAQAGYGSSSSHTHHEKPHSSKLEQSYEQFDTRNASQSHLIYAEGDMPKNKISKFYNFLLNVSVVTRWILFIVPVLGAIWIPGLLGIFKFPNAKIWAVKLIWWSIWLSVAWGGWWAALAISRILPSIARATVGVVAVGTRRYIEWMQVLHRYMALFGWSLALWASWVPLIKNHQVDPGDKSRKAVDLIAKLLFALLLCSGVLLFEKFSIQWIAGKFHERSYAERIADQKHAVKALVTLYRFSNDTPGRTDVLGDGHTPKGSFANPKRVFKKITKGVRMAATTTTTALGNVASEIAGSSVLQPNSPQAIVKTALESANKSRLLARRIFYSFAKPRAEYMLVEDIQKYFPTPEEAESVFALFDKDANGDASREEVEMALMEFHREQLSIENSMRDLDSAVGRLDNILMSLYVIIAALILAVALEAELVSLITGAGTLILGLSWLIGGSLQEVLTSIIFLFVKHPFDVGDRVVINKETYTVKEIRLLSTIFLDGNSTSVQAPNNQLNTAVCHTKQMSETFTFDVAYSTSFEDLEKLRQKMLVFVTEERRDYHPAFDVNIKAKRRNKWICALKGALKEVGVFGPTGNPSPPPPVARYTQVPWDTILYEDQKAAMEKQPSTGQQRPGDWDLQDNKNAGILDPSSDVFGDGSEGYVSTPHRELSQDPIQQRYQQAHAPPMPTAYAGMPAPSVGASGSAYPPHSQPYGGDSIEMTPRR
ncbi:Mechanosensitive ion channel-domain-containing protein [Ephemerocybe angulata]|uniref:Mechanosensitive ion channel-domain-containing protein n=1 Tax=Ephemerocybe angulata TaxID=980116 RepID=A0A8H6I7D1_9AGAR|nr:Mechanosensitive ion channel-domain-containing protein [Tulosesus angulatus]